MTTSTTTPATLPGRASPVLTLMDAEDQLSRARDMVRLISMTTHMEPDDEQKAIAVACESISIWLDEVAAAIRQHRNTNRKVAA